MIRSLVLVGALLASESSFSHVIDIDAGDAGSSLIGQNYSESFSNLRGVGDIDGDGVEDWAIGAAGYDKNPYLCSNEGRVYLYSGATHELIFIIEGIAGAQPFCDNGLNGPAFGAGIHTAGDLNYDGFDDFYVTAPRADRFEENGEILYDCSRSENPFLTCWDDRGMTFVFSGYHAAIEKRAKLLTFFEGEVGRTSMDIVGFAFGDQLGRARTIPDQNYDFHPDIAVGAPKQDFCEKEDDPEDCDYHWNGGAVYIYDSQLAQGCYENIPTWDMVTWCTQAGAMIKKLKPPESPKKGYKHAHWGRSIAVLDDYDFDGIPEVAIGADWQKTFGMDLAGKVYILSGGQQLILDRVHEGKAVAYQLGRRIVPLGDLDLDGVLDYALSAYLFKQGRIHVYSGFTGIELHAQKLKGEDGFDNYGFSISGNVDLNGDSIPEIIVGAPNVDTGEDTIGDPGSGGLTPGTASWTDTGRVYIHDGATGQLLYRITGENDWDQFGTHVMGMPGANHGEDVIAVSSWQWDNLENLFVNVGKVYFFGRF